jgi:ABC-2 type transport system permease protein
LDVISKVTYLALNLLFWYIIQEAGFSMEGWEYEDIVVFLAFSELFYGLDGAVFTYASRFWMSVYAGSLDNTLTRPMDARVRFLLLHVDYLSLVLAFVEFAVLLLFSGKSLNFLSVLFGVFVVVGANLILTLLRLCASYLAFWHGKMSAVSEISDCLTSFNKYPLTILPKPLVYAFKFVFPFYFFSTFSAELVCFTMETTEVLISGAGFAVLLVLWSVLNKILWEMGLKRYESILG